MTYEEVQNEFESLLKQFNEIGLYLPREKIRFEISDSKKMAGSCAAYNFGTKDVYFIISISKYAINNKESVRNIIGHELCHASINGMEIDNPHCEGFIKNMERANKKLNLSIEEKMSHDEMVKSGFINYFSY